MHFVKILSSHLDGVYLPEDTHNLTVQYKHGSATLLTTHNRMMVPFCVIEIVGDDSFATVDEWMISEGLTPNKNLGEGPCEIIYDRL